MRNEIPSDVIHKEVVIIGNGPSGIALSYMLSGNLPYLVSDKHPDEMLSARLKPAVGENLIHQNLDELAAGLEGRSTNQISVLYDALEHPCADIGLELEPLIQFRKAGKPIDHIVLGKGPPGGSWHTMDPYVLTLSLGSWMALPGLAFHCRDSGEKRAFASNVAKYYSQYVEQMHLHDNFRNNVTVGHVKQIQEDCLEPKIEEEHNSCSISSAINRLLLRSHRKSKENRCKRPRDDCNPDDCPSRKIRELQDKKRSISLSSCDSNIICDRFYSKSLSNETSFLNNIHTTYVPYYFSTKSKCDCLNRWIVSAVDNKTGKKTTYNCKYLILANGASDLPNKLEISRKRNQDPSWLVHDLRSLESHLAHDRKIEDPVLIVGAGLSAADAVIAVRSRNIPVIHVFRNKSADLNKQLPENMYPEYHKVHQMMQDGGSTYPLYNAYPEYTLTGFDERKREVVLTSKSGELVKIAVSFAAVLIGARPDLGFLPNNAHVGINKEMPVDCKTNMVDIDKRNHRVIGYENLFAVGPLAGDYFVRFIPGGALAVVADLYKDIYC